MAGPYVMTYNSLIESVTRYVVQGSNVDLTAELPRMIDNTERKVARALKTLMSVKFAADTMQPNINLYAKPNRWLETVSFEIGTGTGYNTTVVLEERTYEYVKTVYPDPTDTGQPKYIADFEFNQFFVGKTPDAAYPFQLGYYERPDPLCGDNQQNWLTQEAPDLMLFGCLLETSPFLINDERTKMWQDFYDRKLIELVGEDARRLVLRSQKTREA
jgi:hypothetical protein